MTETSKAYTKHLKKNGVSIIPFPPAISDARTVSDVAVALTVVGDKVVASKDRLRTVESNLNFFFINKIFLLKNISDDDIFYT